MYPLRSPRNSGFTLIEVLLAVTIFALLSMMFIGTLDYLLSALSSQKITYKQFQLPDMAYQQIKLDVAQTVDRSVLGKNGLSIPAFFGGQEHGGNTWEADVDLDFAHDQTLFEMTRSGNIASLSGNLTGNLERVSYVFQGGELIRYSWPVLDRVEETKAFPQVILNNVQTISVEFLGEDGAWHEGWQPRQLGSSDNSATYVLKNPPLAIKLKCKIGDLDDIEWMFWIGHGEARV